ncbi:TetR/AcrR family transcriptional regulator [Streptomyces poonensis]|uniref:TetR family transcriptional regulator n=1 Tax=Streptomyces poonensis TaxID=68255 RepID=A0A918PXF6_9ACTN|nr:TetR/AcrR family transcriptional regulator C-terminal domain-containing protein [Streptomyces poonensis]GGZ24446.1 TetR family transcriptional regulator [Streptomyces poonensis]GLJ89979.1 TetR family transcriptional regulator [Streptomyces poonensis]
MVRAADRAKRPARASVWLADKARAERGGQPSGLDRERITATAVRLLDAEGLAKFSMRRLAAELSVTAMSVYWYVDTKDDLLELALDRVLGEIGEPERVPDEDWRDEMRALAARYRGVLVRHPWVSPLQGTFLNIGPNALHFSTAVQQVVGRAGLPTSVQAGAMAAVFQFVYGFGTNEGHFIERCAAAGVSQDEYFSDAMTAVTRSPLATGVIEGSKTLMEARGGDTVAEMFERDFTMALDILIAGIEAMVARPA